MATTRAISPNMKRNVFIFDYFINQNNSTRNRRRSTARWQFSRIPALIFLRLNPTESDVLIMRSQITYTIFMTQLEAVDDSKSLLIFFSTELRAKRDIGFMRC